MKSPFPGMDPYLERHWGDVHRRLVIYASDQLGREGTVLADVIQAKPPIEAERLEGCC